MTISKELIDKVKSLYEQAVIKYKNNHINIFYDSIDNEKHFLRGIKFYRSLLFANKYFNGGKDVYNQEKN